MIAIRLSPLRFARPANALIALCVDACVRLVELVSVHAMRGVPVKTEVAPLAHHVLRVIPRRPQEQVRRIAARAIVAAVANAQPVGNWAVGDDPRSTVGEDFVCARWPSHFAVAIPHPVSLPFPAFVRTATGDKSGKTFGQRLSPSRKYTLRHSSNIAGFVRVGQYGRRAA